MSGPDLCRPRQQASFKIVGFVGFVCFFLFVPESVWWHTHGGPCLEKLVYGRILLEGGPSSRKACLEKLSLSAWAQ